MKTSRTLLLTLLAALTFAACDSGGASSSVNADAGDDRTVDVGAQVTLSGAGSSDADGGTLTYTWAFATQPAGSTASLASSSASATFTPDVPGAYVARLTVSNGIDSDTDEVTITAEQAQITSLDGDVTADRTLAPGVYEVPAGRTVRVVGAALTLSPGVQIRFGSGAGFQINADGALVSAGTAAQPVVLRGEQEQRGWWRGLAIYSADRRNRLAHTTVAHGGSARYVSMFAAANVSLDDGARLELEDSTIRESSGLGLSADPGVAFGTFARNTFVANETSPLQLAPQTAEALDGASSFAGNEDDFVELYDRNVTDDMTLAALDVPYRVSGTPDIADALLIVEAGVELVFRSGAGLQVGRDAAIDLRGTASQRITARGEQATPGYWQGLAIYSNDTRNAIANATIEDGGGGRFVGMGAPANVALDDNVRLTVTSSTIRNSAAWGIHADAGAVLTATGVSYTGNASGDVNGG